MKALLILTALIVGCSSSPRLVKLERAQSAPVVVDTVLRVPLAEVNAVYANPTTSATLVLAPEVLVFEQKDTNGNVLKRFTLNNTTRTLRHEQPATTVSYRFVYATIATLRNDTVVAERAKFLDGSLRYWLVVLAFVALLVVCCFYLYKTLKED